MATEAIVAPLYAPIGDRFGRRPVILILTACWGLFAMGFGTAKSVLVAVVLRGARECQHSMNIRSRLILSGSTGGRGCFDKDNGRGAL